MKNRIKPLFIALFIGITIITLGVVTTTCDILPQCECEVTNKDVPQGYVFTDYPSGGYVAIYEFMDCNTVYIRTYSTIQAQPRMHERLAIDCIFFTQLVKEQRIKDGR